MSRRTSLPRSESTKPATAGTSKRWWPSSIPLPRGSPTSRRWEAARSRGHDEIRSYLKSLQEDWVGFRHEPEEFFDAGDVVVAFLHTYAQGRGSGADVEMSVAHVLRFADGKCLGYVSYGDRDEAMRAAGLKQ